VEAQWYQSDTSVPAGASEVVHYHGGAATLQFQEIGAFNDK